MIVPVISKLHNYNIIILGVSILFEVMSTNDPYMTTDDNIKKGRNASFV